MDHSASIVFFSVLIAVLGAILVCRAGKRAKARDEAEQKQAEEANSRARISAIAEQKQREEDEHFKRVDALYSGCRKRRVTEWGSNESKIVLIARSILNEPDLKEEDIQKLFELGKERYEIAEREKKDAVRRQECDEVQAEKARAELIGKEKYYTNTLEQMKICKKLVDDWHKRVELRSQFVASAGMQPKPKNTVASATINSMLFGTAAGVAAAERTRVQNEQAQATYNSLQNTLRETFLKPTDEDVKAMRAEGFLEELIQFKDTIDLSVCSDEDEGYFEFLDVSVKQKRMSKSRKNIIATIEIGVGNPEFFDTYGILDGSLHLIAKLNGKTIGEGFFCGAGFGDVCYKYELGFEGHLANHLERRTHKTHEADVLIQINDDVDLSTIRDVSIEVRPYHLWLLEGDVSTLDDEGEQ